MKMILVASDFSACAANALEYALELAKILKFQVTVIHAIGTTEGVDNNMYKALYIDDYYAQKRQALQAWAQTIAVKGSFADVPVTTLCEVGSVSVVITKFMTTNETEMLVMGTMGSTGIAGLFGSNTSTMISKSKKPMLVVPLESKFSPKPVITLATDFTTKLSPEDVTALTEMAAAYCLEKLAVLNVVEGNAWKTNQQGEAQLRSLLPGIELDFSYVNEDSKAEGIINFITSNHTDILCLVKHHHNVLYRIFNRSTVNQVANKAIKAVLVLHED